jgi:hypothetical protein
MSEELKISKILKTLMDHIVEVDKRVTKLEKKKIASKVGCRKKCKKPCKNK